MREDFIRYVGNVKKKKRFYFAFLLLICNFAKMSNTYFSFKHFTLHQDLCAMKVGTDGVLLGGWATGGRRVLDIGCGTGVVALMMAQRYPESHVTAIDIDEGAYRQTVINAAASPFADRVEVCLTSLQNYFTDTFDAIVCNPPYFTNDLKGPDAQRNVARHTDSLSYSDLFSNVKRLLLPTGVFSLIIPENTRKEIDFQSVLHGFYPLKVCAVKTTPTKPAKRYLYSYGLMPQPCVQSELIIGSDVYKELLKDFYL